MSNTTKTTEDLFPAPKPLESTGPASLPTPAVWPGISPASTQALRNALQVNHEKWHVYFDLQGFHNHIAHYVLALWTLGAPAEIISAAYASLEGEQMRVIESPGKITRENFGIHLGDHRYWKAYIAFFRDVMKTKSVSEVLEEYVFDIKANFDGGENGQEMLNRFLDMLLHPIIHTGYGIELGIPGMVIEGLASTAVHNTTASVLIRPSLWSTSIERSIESLTLQEAPLNNKNIHAFTVLARILNDPRFHGITLDDTAAAMYSLTLTRWGDAIREHADAWSYNASDPAEVARKIEELAWANTIIYGVAGWDKATGDFNADFFGMHLVTSTIFLPTIAAHLKPASQERLLRAYFVVCLSWWIMRGRPGFDIKGFFAQDTAYPLPQSSTPSVTTPLIVSPESPQAHTPNPWFHIIQHALTNPDDHLPKLQRALAHWGSVYGSRKAGKADFEGTELEGAESLDGSLFLRVAGLTKARMVRLREEHVEGPRYWDRRGFYAA
ncbi:Oxidoreductase AflY [Hypsizygus marmoreus]|uniref:Oxidoreductase AflY n=1 Tax=Hypsizygus marmoreus TaxID=39966 RepID=A0A369JPY1_HYPMA|nr:Oxidoreductase AflY [Hypsizygus marmoreus]